MADCRLKQAEGACNLIEVGKTYYLLKENDYSCSPKPQSEEVVVLDIYDNGEELVALIIEAAWFKPEMVCTLATCWVEKLHQLVEKPSRPTSWIRDMNYYSQQICRG